MLNSVTITSGKMTNLRFKKSPQSGKDIVVYHIHVIKPGFTYREDTSYTHSTVYEALPLSCTGLKDKARGILTIAV